MTGLKIVLALTIALLTACAGAPETPETTAEESEPSVVTTADTVPNQLDAIMRDLSPRAGRPIFLGVSPRLRIRDDEEARAILHVAEQASRYARIGARYQLVTQRGGRSVGYLDDIQANWDADFADRLIDSVEILQTIRDDQGTYVLAQVEGIPPAPAIDMGDHLHGTDEPRWLSQPPVIPGFLVTVGVSLRSRRLRDSVDTADQEALKEILLQAGTTVRLMEERRDVDRVGTTERTTAAEDAEAVLRQFLVLARYTPPDGRYYYSLVIAREE